MSKQRIQTSIVTKARRTELVDAQEVSRYVNKQTQDLFGPNVKELGKIFELIEKSVLSITLEDEQANRILAQASFYDYPRITSTSSSSWETWLQNNYQPSKISSFNTLFLTFFVAQPEFSIGCAEEIIKSAFKAVPECHYILLCAPISVVPEASLAVLFDEVKRLPDGQSKETAVFVAKREKFVPVLFVRESNVHDNDDLCPLFNSYTDLLKATYGDFYVAEMIEAQNDNNKCLTAEAEGFGVGFMAITNDVNTKLLNDCFELQPFHGLCKPNEEDVLTPPFFVEEEENDDDDVVVSNGASKTQVNSQAQMNSQQASFDVPEIKHKLSDVGLNLELTDIEGGDKSNEDEQSNKTHSELSNYSAVKPESTKSSKKIAFYPQYAGESNAFAIQLFCIEEKYESRSIDFLQRAFEMFPDKDFCIITLPPIVPEFTLIQNFFRVTPKVTNKLGQELYLFHRAGLAKDFKVREANQEKDFEAVERLVGNLHSKNHILEDFRAFLKSRKDANGVNIQAFVAEVLGRIVGFCIVRSEEDIEYLRSNFNIDYFIYYTHHKREEHGHMNHFALLPIFGFLTKFFIREILRYSSKTSLYYPIYPENAPKNLLETYSLVTCLNFMVPVKKRKQIEYNPQKLGINLPSANVLNQKYNYVMPCALNHINRKLLLEPKIAINLRIVVVGASELAVSFLETLIFSPHLRFNNITLVSANGLPGMLLPDSLRDNIKAHTLNYDQNDHAHLSLRSWVNVILGKMTSIDRRRKNICINGQAVLPYDHLILCTGEQYYLIAPLQARIYNSYSRQEVKPHITRPFFDTHPSNMFVINNEYEAEHFLIYLEKNNLLNSNENIIVYGLDLNVLSMLHTLTKAGVSLQRVHLFCDKNANNQYAINNSFVTSKVHEELIKLKINIHKSYHFDDCNNGRWSSDMPIKTVTFVKSSAQENSSMEDDPRVIQLECCLFLCYYRKDVDYTTFIAANNSNLVYDGRLVVDNDFHTNDSCIRAAGKMTKYKRSYYVDNWSHGCFNQKEVGTDLANNILKLVDPTLVSEETEEEIESARLAANDPSEKCLIKLYKKPLMTYAVLPGDYHYLNVTKPGLFMTYDEEKNEGQELVTSTDSGYFRIHLNKHSVIQTITCLSKKKFNVGNFSRLYGLHEQFLNKLLLKYKQGIITDLYTFFSENWCTALYHDRFEDLCKEIRELSTKSTSGIKPVNDLLREQVDKDLILTQEQSKSIREYFVKSQTKSMVEKRLLNYLNYNSNHLPMYAKPDMV